MNNFYKMILNYKYPLLSAMIVILIIHTLMITNGYTIIIYERLRDVAIAIFTFVLVIISMKYHSNSELKFLYLIIANVFFIICTSHILKIILGSYKC